MSLPHHGFYTTDEQMVHVRGKGPFIHVFEGSWASRYCGGLPTCRQAAWGPLGMGWQWGSLACFWGHWQDSAHNWCLKTLHCWKHHLLLAKKYGQGIFLSVEVC